MFVFENLADDVLDGILIGCAVAAAILGWFCD